MIQVPDIFKSNILIVDDEPANIRLLNKLLESKGYKNIQSITDPRKTLELYLEFKPDLVLLDLNMPHLNGLEVMEQVNNSNQQEFIPIMILTGQTDQQYRLKALELGARDFLSKPFDLIELSMRIRNLLEIRLFICQLNREHNELEEKFNERSFELAVAMTKLKKQNQRIDND